MASLESYPGSKVANVIVVNSLLLALATVAIVLRLVARGVYLKAIGLDDGQQSFPLRMRPRTPADISI